jgi:hypothetical protein
VPRPAGRPCHSRRNGGATNSILETPKVDRAHKEKSAV